MSERLEAPIAHDWREDVSSQTVVQCWRRDRQKVTRCGWMEMMVTIHKDSPILTAMRMCIERACEQPLWNGAIDLTKARGVYNLSFQVAGGEGNVERSVDVSPNEMDVAVERGSHVSEKASASEPVRPREMGVPSDGGERQLSQECQLCLRSRHKPSKMSSVPQAMQPIVRGVSIVSQRTCRCGHPLDICGHHCAACAAAGVLGRRGFAIESVVVGICWEEVPE